MKHLLIVLIISSFFLISCGEDKQAFNNNLVSQIDKAGTDIDSMYTRLNRAVEQTEYTAISKITDETTDSLRQRIEEINKIHTVKGGTELHQASISYLQALIKIADSYNVYSTNSVETTDEQILEMNTNVSSAEQYAENELTKLITTQREFATKNNITLTD